MSRDVSVAAVRGRFRHRAVLPDAGGCKLCIEPLVRSSVEPAAILASVVNVCGELRSSLRRIRLCVTSGAAFRGHLRLRACRFSTAFSRTCACQRRRRGTSWAQDVKDTRLLIIAVEVLEPLPGPRVDPQHLGAVPGAIGMRPATDPMPAWKCLIVELTRIP